MQLKAHINSLLISLAVISSAYLLSQAYLHRNKSNQTISVTGLGEKDFSSDLIVWSGSFSRKNMVLNEAYLSLDKDREMIRNYLIEKGLNKDEFKFSSVSIDREYDRSYDNNGNLLNSVFSGYNLSQYVNIESKQVDLVENISREVSELIISGIELYSQLPQYYYTRLATLKVEMIADATKDAKNRAEKISGNAGGKLGRLLRADMGVFQIVARNSSEEYTWGGSFNTSSKNKTASITVKLDYETD